MKQMALRHLAAWVIACTLLPSNAAAARLDESVVGDLSGNPAAPTPWLLDGAGTAANGETGHNVISGRTGRDANGIVDRDYVVVVVPEGYVWSELRVGQQTVTAGPAGSFIGLAQGATMPLAPEATSAVGLLGWKHYGPADRGTDILAAMAAGVGATGYTPALPAGSYTLWIQEAAVGSYDYRFNLVLAPVPEAPAGLLALAGVAVLLAGRHGRAPRA